MNYRMRLPPVISGTRQKDGPIGELWSTLSWESAKFCRHWGVGDSELESDRTRGHMVLGLAMAVAISASFWTATGLMVARLLR